MKASNDTTRTAQPISAAPPPNPPMEQPSREWAAISALTPEEKNRLCRFGYWRMLPIRGTVHHCDGEDLYNEAVSRTLEGRRKWNEEKNNIFQHLCGTMRSIADEWYKEMKRYEELSDMHSAPDTLNAEVTREILLQRIARELEEDVMGSAVFESLRKAEKPSEAIARLNIPRNVYHAAKRRALRLSRRLLLFR